MINLTLEKPVVFFQWRQHFWASHFIKKVLCMRQTAITKQKIPTSHWGRLASAVAQIDIWQKRRNSKVWKLNVKSFVSYTTETKYRNDLWEQNLKKRSQSVLLNSPGELLVQVVWFWRVEFYSHVKAVWWANWKTERNKGSEHARVCRSM